MTRNDVAYIKDILAAIENVKRYMVGVSRAEFLSNPLLQDAVVRNLEIVGEAASRLSQETRDTNEVVPWREIIGMRNRLIHAYFTVDSQLLWEILENDLDLLYESVRRML